MMKYRQIWSYFLLSEGSRTVHVSVECRIRFVFGDVGEAAKCLPMQVEVFVDVAVLVAVVVAFPVAGRIIPIVTGVPRIEDFSGFV
jgi:hypothetical protein